MCTDRKAEDNARRKAEPHPEIPRDALIDAAGNPRPLMHDRFEPRYRPIEPIGTGEERVATSVMVLAIAAMVGLVFALAIGWPGKPVQDMAMNQEVPARTAQP